MGTESGKTCGECKSEPRLVMGVHRRYVVILCKKHDGSMAKLAEALRRFHDREGCNNPTCPTGQLLAAYDELQGRKG